MTDIADAMILYEKTISHRLLAESRTEGGTVSDMPYLSNGVRGTYLSSGWVARSKLRTAVMLTSAKMMTSQAKVI